MSLCTVCLQEQYIFVHDLMCDYVSSGNTSVEAHTLGETVDKLTQPVSEDGATGFEEQFRVRDAAQVLVDVNM